MKTHTTSVVPGGLAVAAIIAVLASWAPPAAAADKESQKLLVVTSVEAAPRYGPYLLGKDDGSSVRLTEVPPDHHEECDRKLHGDCTRVEFEVTGFNGAGCPTGVQVINKPHWRNCKQVSKKEHCTAVWSDVTIVFKASTLDYRVRFSPFEDPTVGLVKKGKDREFTIDRLASLAYYKFSVEGIPPACRKESIDPNIIVTK